MDKYDKRKTTSDINEEQMMNMMVDGIQKEGMQYPLEKVKVMEKQERQAEESSKNKPSTTEKIKIKKSSAGDYENIFFRKSETNARNGKTVYIRSEFHEKLLRIVQVIGEDKLSLYAYLDNLLDYHFKEFGDEIVRSFNEKYKPIL
ncbi:conjugal transfer protein TraB [Elizabethkingia anophelis]|nr:conjugal transfer protein TraB [Elizabethkingia anophelis]